MENKKTNIHMVQHTHWDREWYFTSDDSRTMLYYDLKFLIEYLENNDDKFTFDGQSSIIDDFLKYSPGWESRFKKVVKAGKLLVGPFYTQTNNSSVHGESIVRNIEVGNHIAKNMGHSMQVGYLPDTFGHNNQTPQILKMNGINNFSFYRGLDPEQTDDQIYFKYKSPDGSEVLGHWQTHYSTNPGAFAYTLDAFDKHIVADYNKKGLFGTSVKSYAKRSFNLPVSIPVGSDQKPFKKEVKEIISKLNKKYKEFNFIVSDYETMLKAVAKEVKDNKVDLPTVTTELRQALTGRVHRTCSSSRADIKQLLFKLESILIDVLEPLSIICELNKVDVPWKMIDHVWKELFKSSAHDSYGTTNEDVVNRKLKNRVSNAIRVAEGIVAMLSRIFSHVIIKEEADAYNKLILFNFQQNDYSGLYEITTTVKRGYENGKFAIMDGTNEVTYNILDRDNIGSHERDALSLIIDVKNVPAFSYKIFDIRYYDNIKNQLTKKTEISGKGYKVKVTKKGIQISKGKEKFDNLFVLAMDPSVGDTYDHSPITHNDKKYLLNNYQVIETSEAGLSIKFKAFGNVPSGLKGWKNDEPSVNQEATIQITITSQGLHAKVNTINKSYDGRMIMLVDAKTQSEIWHHDQQFGIYTRKINNDYMKTWDKPNKYGYKWDEYPTNLSSQQSYITNNDKNFTVFTSGTKEHEMINYKDKKQFAITLYRAFGVFGRDKFLYRPGRASGAYSDAPDCQMIGDRLEFSFLFDFGKKTEMQQFNKSKQLISKNFYIPKQWGLSRTILRWDTDIQYYSRSSSRSKKPKIPAVFKKDQFVLSAMYKDVKGRMIARFLNLGPEIKINPGSQQISRNLIKFANKLVHLPKYGLINVIIGE